MRDRFLLPTGLFNVKNDTKFIDNLMEKFSALPPAPVRVEKPVQKPGIKEVNPILVFSLNSVLRATGVELNQSNNFRDRLVLVRRENREDIIDLYIQIKTFFTRKGFLKEENDKFFRLYNNNTIIITKYKLNEFAWHDEIYNSLLWDPKELSQQDLLEYNKLMQESVTLAGPSSFFNVVLELASQNNFCKSLPAGFIKLNSQSLSSVQGMQANETYPAVSAEITEQTATTVPVKPTKVAMQQFFTYVNFSQMQGSEPYIARKNTTSTTSTTATTLPSVTVIDITNETATDTNAGATKKTKNKTTTVDLVSSQTSSTKHWLASNDKENVVLVCNFNPFLKEYDIKPSADILLLIMQNEARTNKLWKAIKTYKRNSKEIKASDYKLYKEAHIILITKDAFTLFANPMSKRVRGFYFAEQADIPKTKNTELQRDFAQSKTDRRVTCFFNICKHFDVDSNVLSTMPSPSSVHPQQPTNEAPAISQTTSKPLSREFRTYLRYDITPITKKYFHNISPSTKLSVIFYDDGKAADEAFFALKRSVNRRMTLSDHDDNHKALARKGAYFMRRLHESGVICIIVLEDLVAAFKGTRTEFIHDAVDMTTDEESKFEQLISNSSRHFVFSIFNCIQYILDNVSALSAINGEKKSWQVKRHRSDAESNASLVEDENSQKKNKENQVNNDVDMTEVQVSENTDSLYDSTGDETEDETDDEVDVEAPVVVEKMVSENTTKIVCPITQKFIDMTGVELSAQQINHINKIINEMDNLLGDYVDHDSLATKEKNTETDESLKIKPIAPMVSGATFFARNFYLTGEMRNAIKRAYESMQKNDRMAIFYFLQAFQMLTQDITVNRQQNVEFARIKLVAAEHISRLALALFNSQKATKDTGRIEQRASGFDHKINSRIMVEVLSVGQVTAFVLNVMKNFGITQPVESEVKISNTSCGHGQ